MDLSLIKQFLRLGFQLLGVLLMALLLGRFGMMIYYPGTPDTAWLFEALAPYWQGFQLLSKALTLPVDVITGLLAHVLPSPLRENFPVTPAPALLQALRLAGSSHSAAQMAPGSLEWSTLISGLLWGIFMMALSLATLLVPDRLSAAEPAKPSARPAGRPVALAPQPQWSAAEAERRMAAGSARIPSSTGSSSEGKAHSANHGVRQILNDLKRENMKLQSRQQEMKKTIAQYFSPNVLAYMEQNRHAFENLQNQRCDVSVLFCDIRGFTAFSQTHSPEEVRAYLSEYFSLANDVILNLHQGVINKLMGDGILAYWGFPIPTPDHALLATQAAMDILKEVNLRNHCLAPGRAPIAVGLGVCSGEALIGNIGSSDFKDFTLIGNPVNLASRLESLNKELDTHILISESTFQGLRGRIPCRDMGNVSVRGWEGQFRAYEPKMR